MHAVDQPSAGDLQRDVGPAEARQNYAQLDWRQVQRAGELRSHDGYIAAIEVIDHHDDKQHHGNEESSLAGDLGHHGRMSQVR
jgi:hypothetical protein